MSIRSTSYLQKEYKECFGMVTCSEVRVWGEADPIKISYK